MAICTDINGQRAANHWIEFSIVSGQGTLGTNPALTNGNGIALSSFTSTVRGCTVIAASVTMGTTGYCQVTTLIGSISMNSQTLSPTTATNTVVGRQIVLAGSTNAGGGTTAHSYTAAATR